MKTKNLIIGVLAIAVITLSYLLYHSHVECKNINNPREDKIVCKDTLISTDAEVTTWNTVKPFIDSFDPNEDVKAFHIGIRNMKLIVSKIDAYNSGLTPANQIIGIRFYRAVTTREFTSAGNVPRTVVDEPDLIAVPTLAEKNLHEVNSSANVPIYWHFRPCPKLCKKKKGNKKK